MSETYSGLPHYGLSAALLSGTIAHTVTASHPLHMQLVEILIPALLCLSPVYVGYQLEQRNFPLEESLKIWGVALFLAFIAAIATVVVVGSTQPITAPSDDVVWLLWSRMTAGVAVGAPIAFFYVQLTQQNRELKAQHREV